MEYDLINDIISEEIDSAYVVAPFDEGKRILESQDYSVISLKQNAGLRIHGDVNSDALRYGNCVREGVLYVPKKGEFLTKNSPVMASAKEATECHRKLREFYLTDSQVQEALSDSVKLSGDSIPTNRFSENEITAYAFGEYAKKYGEFLMEAGIKQMPVWLTELQDKSFIRQIWFGGLVYGRSDLSGGGRGLDGGGRMRGVRESA